MRNVIRGFRMGEHSVSGEQSDFPASQRAESANCALCRRFIVRMHLRAAPRIRVSIRHRNPDPRFPQTANRFFQPGILLKQKHRMRFQFPAFFQHLQCSSENDKGKNSLPFQAVDQNLQRFLHGEASSAVQNIESAEDQNRFRTGASRNTGFQTGTVPADLLNISLNMSPDLLPNSRFVVDDSGHGCNGDTASGRNVSNGQFLIHLVVDFFCA